jgi:hypothetical protein
VPVLQQQFVLGPRESNGVPTHTAGLPWALLSSLRASFLHAAVFLGEAFLFASPSWHKFRCSVRFIFTQSLTEACYFQVADDQRDSFIHCLAELMAFCQIYKYTKWRF